MRINGLQIERFGAWMGLKLERFAKGLIVFYGPNEAGKTTLLQFLRSMFFGYADEEIQRYLSPIAETKSILSAGSRAGGSMTLVSGGDEYHLRRYASTTGDQTYQGDVRLTTSQGERVGAHRLQSILAGVDQTTFNHVFAVGLRELQQLATLDETEAARQLYSLSTGTDRVSLVDVMRQLQAAQQRLAGTPGSAEDCYLGQLLSQKSRILEQLQTRERQAERWIELQAQSNLTQEELRSLQGQLQRNRELVAQIQLALQVIPRRERIAELQQELQRMGPVKEIPIQVIEQAQALQQEVQRSESELQRVQTESENLRTQRERLEAQAPTPRGLSRIETLLDQRQGLQSLADRRAQAHDRLAEIDLEIEAEQQALGMDGSVRTDRGGQRLEPHRLHALADLAGQWDRQRERLEQLQQQGGRHKEELNRLEGEITAVLSREPDLFSKEDAGDLLAALKKTGDLAARLREQVREQRRLKQLRREFLTLQEQEADVYRNQILPWDVTLGVGALFALGAFFTILAFFGEWFQLTNVARSGFGVMGLVGMGVAAALKIALELVSRDDFQDYRDRLAQRQRALSETQKRLADLKQQIPARRSGPLKLEDAEQRLKSLERVLPLETRRRQLRRTLEQHELAVQQASDEARYLGQLWEDSLKRLGLSANLAPQQIKGFIQNAEKLTNLQRLREQLSDEVATLDREWSNWQLRVAALAEEVLQATRRPVEPLSLLTDFQQVLDRHAALRQQRDVLLDQEDRLKTQCAEIQANLRLARRQLQTLLSSWSALDLEDLTRRREAWVKRSQLQERHQQAIQALLELASPEEEQLLQRELGQASPAQLSERLKQLTAEAQRAETLYQQVQERQAGLALQIQELVADRQLGRLRLELNMLDAQLEEALDQWRVITAMSFLLQSVYKKYEKERQPETLRDASRYFQRMSCGRYTRVWTPLAEDILLADAADGRTIPAHQLSSGTREQMYLSLRLALVQSYARRGIEMPVILDDVLVNFDEERTRAAAEVLAEFAQEGHQVFIFTCHNHVTAIFRQLNADVRELPQRVDLRTNESQPAKVQTPPPRRVPRPIRRRPGRVILGFDRPDPDADGRHQTSLPPQKERPASIPA